MAQDPRTALVTARIQFEGIMLMCINKNKNNRCEVGLLNCANHKSTLVVQTEGPGGLTGPSTFDITGDLCIRAVNPQTEGVTLRSVGDDTDFGHLPDLERADFHGDKVAVALNKLLAKLSVSAGEFYSHELTQDEYDLVKFTEASPTGVRVKKFGPLVDKLCLNIECKDGAGSGIEIIDVGKAAPIVPFLPKLTDTTYFILVSNDCGGNQTGVGPSDFRFYYDVVTPPGAARFDFEKHVRGTPSPNICETAFLGKTDSLGLAF